MIRINLLGEKVDNSAAYALHALVGGVSVCLVLAGCFIFQQSVSDQLELTVQQKSMLDKRLAELQEKTKKVENLDKDRQLLKEKLTTIATLKAQKAGPVRILDDLTGAIPDHAWLRTINHKSEGLEFEGVAVDPQTVSVFMSRLEASKWFSGVELIYSSQVLEQNVPVQKFSLLAKLRNPLEVRKLEAKALCDAGKGPCEETKKSAKASQKGA